MDNEVTEKVSVDDIIKTKYPNYANMSEDEQDDFWDELSESEKYEINQKTTEANGFGQNCLYCNEIGRGNFKEFSNLLEWDIADWNVQRDLCLKDQYMSFDRGEYNFDTGMFDEWIRLIENSKLVYGSLRTLYAHLWWIMEDIVFDVENEIVPHDIEWHPTPKVVHEDGEQCLCNEITLVVNAYGREDEYEKISSLRNKYIENNGRGSELVKQSAQGFTGTFRVDNFENPTDPYSIFIVCDRETLGKIKPESFLNDFHSNATSAPVLNELTEKFKKIIENDFREYINSNK